MKKLLLLVLIATQTVFNAGAQPPRRDTAFGWGGSPNAPYYNAILRAPVVSGESEAITIVPTRGPLCFDKMVRIKSTVGGRVVEQCLYINTTDGLTGYVSPVTTGSANMCDIKPDDKDFNFSIIGLKGNVYIYHNNEGKQGRPVEHWVSTGNTERRVYEMPTNTGMYTLHNKRERRDYCEGKIKGTAYKYDGATAPTMYLFGKNYPDDINVTSNKYIGNFGIGYQYTDKGLYIIMELVSSAYTCKITSIEDVNVCFDPSPFVVQEDEFKTKRTAELQKEWDKLARKEEQVMRSDNCQTEKMAVINYQKEMLRKQEAYLQTINRGGNTYQDQNVQNAYSGMMDPLDIVREGILSNKASICATERSLSEHPNSNSTQEKMACLQAQSGRLAAAETQMMANNTTFARSPGKAKAENSKLYLQLMRTACN